MFSDYCLQDIDRTIKSTRIGCTILLFMEGVPFGRIDHFYLGTWKLLVRWEGESCYIWFVRLYIIEKIKRIDESFRSLNVYSFDSESFQCTGEVLVDRFFTVLTPP